MSSENNQRFPSKVDWWLGVLLAVLPLATLASAIFSVINGHWVGASGVVLVGVIYGSLVFPMYYEIGDDALVVRFGLARSRIPYKDIRRVVPTRNPLSSPALSLDRLHIDAGKSGTRISPADRAGFLRALAEHTPQLELRGSELLPRAAAG